MRIVARYSHKGGAEFLSANHPAELDEVVDAISRIDANIALTKTSKEKTMLEQLLYSPVALNKAIKSLLYPLDWATLNRNGKYSEARISLTVIASWR